MATSLRAILPGATPVDAGTVTLGSVGSSPIALRRGFLTSSVLKDSAEGNVFAPHLFHRYPADVGTVVLGAPLLSFIFYQLYGDCIRF